MKRKNSKTFEIASNCFLIRVPFEEAYPKTFLTRTLLLNYPEAETLLADGVFEGEHSTELHPVDHVRLVEYLEQRAQPAIRKEFRDKVLNILSELYFETASD